MYVPLLLPIDEVRLLNTTLRYLAAQCPTTTMRDKYLKISETIHKAIECAEQIAAGNK
jgi:hypothetical protein